jgi:hypothetical protein
MEFFILWAFVSIEKIAAFLAIGGTLFKWALIAYGFMYLLGFLLSKGKEDMQSYNTKMSKHRKLAVTGVIIGALLFTTSALLPTKKELAVIVGGGVTYQLLTSDTAKEVGGKAVELLKKQIDDALKDETVNIIKKEATEQTKEVVKGVINA